MILSRIVSRSCSRAVPFVPHRVGPCQTGPSLRTSCPSREVEQQRSLTTSLPRSSPKLEAELAKQKQQELDNEAHETRTQTLRRKLYGSLWTVGLAGSVVGTWYASRAVLTTIGTIYANPHMIAYIGFWSGVACSTVAAATAFGVYRLTFIRPENVYHQSVAALMANEKAKNLLGNRMVAAKLKTYAVGGGRVMGRGIGSSSFTWQPHSCEMAYLVHGERASAIVLTKCTKVTSLVPGKLTVDFLAAQAVGADGGPSGSPVQVLSGDPTLLQSQGTKDLMALLRM